MIYANANQNSLLNQRRRLVSPEYHHTGLTLWLPPLVVQEREHVLLGGHQKINDEDVGRVHHRLFGGCQVQLLLLPQEVVQTCVFRQRQVVERTRVVRVTGSPQPACVRGAGESAPIHLIEFLVLDDDDDNKCDEENETPEAKQNGRTSPEADAASIFLSVVHGDKDARGD